jgi:hypothetical protein
MELDFDDIDIPISDARLSHLSPVPSSAVPVNAANNGSSSGIGSKRGHKGAGRKGAGAGSNVLDKQLQGADQDDHDLEDGLLIGDDDVMDGTGLMDWQSIDTGGQCIRRGSEQLDTATLMTSSITGLLLFCSRKTISPCPNFKHWSTPSQTLTLARPFPRRHHRCTYGLTSLTRSPPGCFKMA